MSLRQSTAAFPLCIAAWVGIIVVDGFDPASLRIHGILDWLGHVLTAMIVTIGLRGIYRSTSVPLVLVGSIVLDLGHLFTVLNVAGEVGGSSRNGSHSLVIVICIAMMGLLDRHRTNAYMGLAIGAFTHLWRDMGTGSVPLLWPVLDVVWTTPYWWNVAVTLLAGFAFIGTGMVLRVQPFANGRKERY